MNGLSDRCFCENINDFIKMVGKIPENDSFFSIGDILSFADVAKPA